LTGELGAAARDPRQLASHLTLVMEGAYASVAALGSEGPVGVARGAAGSCSTPLSAEQVLEEMQ
jgi:hypothetical protein